MFPWKILLGAALCCAPLGTSAHRLGAPQDGEEEVAPEVDVRAVLDTERFVPGEVFHAAVVFDIPEHWHIYWENSGDTGFPTEVAVCAPEGVEILPTLYPGPTRLLSEGGLVSFGYEGSTALFVPLRVPTDSELERLDLQLEVTWLVCKKACFLGDASLRVGLDRAEEGEAPRSIHGETLDPHRANLPAPASELEGLQVEYLGKDAVRDVRLRLPGGAAIEFFPAVDAPLVFEGQRASRSGPHTELIIDLSAPYGVKAPILELRGVLRVESASGPRFYQLRIPDSERR